MHQDTLTLYKLIILQILDRVSYPVTQAKISSFLLEKEYTDYMRLQEAIVDLADAELITATTQRNRTFLMITEEGKHTLDFFSNRINPSIKEDIEQFLLQNEMSMKNEFSIQADYYKSTSGEYDAHMLVKEKDITVVELKLSVPTEEIASTICANWKNKYQNIYQYITGQLF